MMRKIYLFVFICVSVLSSACASQVDEVIEDLSTPTIVISSPSSITLPTLEPTWTIQPTIRPAEVPSPMPDSVRILSEGEGMESSGPWLLFQTNAGLLLVSEEGDEIGLFLKSPFTYLSTDPAPLGGMLRINHEEDFIRTIQVVSIRDWEILNTQNLLDYDGKSLSFSTEDELIRFEFDRYTGVGDSVWSSDGSKLAFVSSHLGPSPDMYVFEVDIKEVTQLSSLPFFAVNPSWSPDDKYVYYAEVEWMQIGKSGAGYSGWTFYSIEVDASKVIKVFDGMEDRGYENVVGWFSDHKVLMDSGYWWCGHFDFRVVNIESGARVSIWPDQYDHIAYDPINKVALVWVMPGLATGEDCGSKGESGLFLVSVPDGNLEKVVGFDGVDIVSSLNWSEESQNFIVDLYGSWALVSPEGEVELLVGQPVFSPDGEMMALFSADKRDLSVVDKSGRTIGVVADGDILYPTWSPDGSSLFFFERIAGSDFYNLYKASAPDFEAFLILEEVLYRHADPPVWVMP